MKDRTCILLGFIILCSALLPQSAVAQARIPVTTPMQPPAWALMERALLRENAKFIEVAAEKYVHPITGYLQCQERWGGSDGPDDAMENYTGWSLLYALGAPASTLEHFEFVWNGHIDQYSRLGMFHKEFITSFDWEHNGEGYAAFFLLPLSDPADWRTRERLVRFADFYTGRDTTTHNYDPDLKIIRSMHNGSRGPRFAATMATWPEAENFDWTDGNGRVGKNGQDIWDAQRGDVPLNLISTSLAVNAFIQTGDGHYRDWVLEYAGAWRERAEANGGIFPSNVSLNGKVGEFWDGKWYGGSYGWNWSFGGWHVLGRGPRIGFANAYFLSGDYRFLDALRRQGDILLQNRKTVDGRQRIPNKYGDQGWYEFTRNPVGDLFTDLYYWTLDERDLARLYESNEGRRNGWFEYLNGRNPEYPVEALGRAFEDIRSKTERIRRDTSTHDTRRSDHGGMGAETAALVNLTMGGLQPSSSGGLLYCQLRYFDPDNRRPGLPEDIGALVTGIQDRMVQVTLVNLDQTRPRNVIVQTGAYGENQCVRVETGGKEFDVGGRFFSVCLSPGAGADLTIHVNRLANRPTFDFPWQ